MNRMNGNMGTETEIVFYQLVSRVIEFQEAVRQTPEAEKLIQTRDTLAERILEATDNAGTIEDLIHCEMALQRLDERSAQSKQDKTGIENAKRDYRQLLETVAQMRRNSDEYFRANMAFRETGGDFRKLPRGRVQQIHANIARLRNRSSFASEEERNIWDARIKLAEKTGEMLRAMHKSKAKEYEQRID